MFRLALTAAVSIGITGSIQAISGTQQSTIDTGNTLRRVALYIFLVCSALVLLQALILARVESSGTAHLVAIRTYTYQPLQRRVTVISPAALADDTVSMSLLLSPCYLLPGRPSSPRLSRTPMCKTTSISGIPFRLLPSYLPSCCL